jgi:membrane-anchored glycerophosphoryl diester phosphodiesterase (GDPDase)
MLNTRIDIDTKQTPYKINRKRPAFLDPCFPGKNDWFIFCERIDGMMLDFEEIKAVWLLLGVVCTFLLLGIIIGIICVFVLLNDDSDMLGIAAACLFAALFFVFALYFFLMRVFVLRPLDNFAQEIDDYCAEVAKKKNDKAKFIFDRSRKCTLFWGSDFKVWIDVSTSEAVDLVK